MEVVNSARHTVAEVTTQLDKAGREHLLIVIKATYRIPDNDKPPRPIVPPQPLAMEDTFTGEPGLSAPLYEADFALRKSRCDVLFNAHAHAPRSIPVKELGVGFRIGECVKSLRVVGDRHWEQSVVSVTASATKEFVKMPLHYGRAFGGSTPYLKNGQPMADILQENPIGTGYAGRLSTDVKFQPLPNLEHFNSRLTRPGDSSFKPVAFSVVARNWLPRRSYAGTYDKHWRENVFPFLPTDFDERFFQCAPEDQQIDFPKGGEDIVLGNMMEGRSEIRFKLPRLDNVPVRFLMRDYRVLTPPVVADTLYFEPDENRFSVIWRASIPIKRSFRKEIQTIAIGHVCKTWWENKVAGRSGCADCAKRAAALAAAMEEDEISPENCPEAEMDQIDAGDTR
jgi:hypothetical protein